MKHWLSKRAGAILVAAFGMLGSPALAQDMALDHVRITLDQKKSRKPPKAKKERTAYERDWKNACDKLGKAMLAGKGPWGFGTFGSYSCYRGKKRVAGQEKPGRWSLDVADGVKAATYTMSYTPPSGGKFEVASLAMPPSPSTFKFYLDDEFADATAFALMERMPMGMQVARANVKGTPPSFVGRYPRAGKSKDFKYKVPEAPGELVLFRLAWDDKAKVWRSAVVGTAKRTKLTEPKKKKKKKATVLDGGEATYEINDAVAQALSTGPLWAQGADGPGARADELDALLAEAHKNLRTADEKGQLLDYINGKVTDLFSSLLDTAASGYVGLRYGISVLSPDSELTKKLLSQTSMIGLLVEVRGGPVKGLRYYYDKVPKTEGKLDGVDGQELTVSLESARHTIGFSFDFDPGLIFDRVTLDPKLGMWSFAAQLPVEQNEEGKTVAVETFKLGNTFSIALEVGLEWLSDWYTLRGWYAIDSGFSLIQQGGRVTSNRFGVDAYFTAGPSFPIFGVPFKTALLAFFVYESVDLTSGKKDPEPGREAISGVSYDNAYAGAGIGVTW